MRPRTNSVFACMQVYTLHGEWLDELEDEGASQADQGHVDKVPVCAQLPAEPYGLVQPILLPTLLLLLPVAASTISVFRVCGTRLGVCG